MKIKEILVEMAAQPGLNEITFSQKEDGKWVVNTKATAGVTIDTIGAIAKQLSVQKKYVKELFTKSGKPIEWFSIAAKRLSGFVVEFKDGADAENILKTAIGKGTADIMKRKAADEKHKATAPERKAAASKAASEQRKKDLEEYARLYGKGTWNRVTYKQEGGDDGYSYVLRVDGRSKLAGLSQREAASEKLKAVKDIAQKEKLGQYAE